MKDILLIGILSDFNTDFSFSCVFFVGKSKSYAHFVEFCIVIDANINGFYK